MFKIVNYLSFAFCFLVHSASAAAVEQAVGLNSEVRVTKSAQNQDTAMSFFGFHYTYSLGSIESVFLGVQKGNLDTGNQTLAVLLEVYELFFGYQRNLDLPYLNPFIGLQAAVSQQQTTSSLSGLSDIQRANPSVQFSGNVGLQTNYDALRLFAKLGLRFDQEWDPQTHFFLAAGFSYRF